MLFLFGTRSNADDLGPVNRTCPACGNSPCVLRVIRQKFTVYFIPTFTTGSRYFIACPRCGAAAQITAAAARRLQLNPHAAGPGETAAEAGATTRISRPGQPFPSDSVLICPKCGAPSPEGARFCNQCATPLDAG